MARLALAAVLPALIALAAYAAQEPLMPATAHIELKPNTVMMQQHVAISCELRNTGSTPLRGVNPNSFAGAAIVRVTHVDSGRSDEFTVGQPAGGNPRVADLAPRQTLTYDYEVAREVQFAGPGEYKISALYRWNNNVDQAVSDPVTLKVTPANPRTLTITSAFGGPGAVSFGVWTHQPEKGAPELWLAELGSTGKPSVQSLSLLATLKEPVVAYSSVPPNAAPSFPRFAWIANFKLRHVLFGNGQASDVAAEWIANGGVIVPPLFELPTNPGQPPAGADAIVYEPGEDGRDGGLRLIQLGSAKRGGVFDVDIPGPQPLWIRSVYLQSQRRYTFFLQQEQQGLTLRALPSAAGRDPGQVFELFTIPGALVGAEVQLLHDNNACGAILVDTNEPENPYRIHRWMLADDKKHGRMEPVRLRTPAQLKFKAAQLAINAGGDPFAILEVDQPDPAYYYATPDGEVSGIGAPDLTIQAPLGLMFRRGVNPTLLVTKPDHGFVFIKPR